MKNKKFLKFALGGIPGTTLNYLILFFAYSVFGMAGKELVFVALVAFVLKEATSFIVHKFWTFESVDKDFKTVHREVWLYGITVVATTTINTFLFLLLAEHWRWNPVLAQAVINFGFFIVNFPAMKKIVFKNGK